MTTRSTPVDSVVIERQFDAPIPLVWQMWTDPEHFASWYGPDGATIPTAQLDLQIGGRRLICMEMTTPGGPMKMWFTGEFREIVEHRRIVYTESMSDADGNVLTPRQAGLPDGHPIETVVTVEFRDLGTRTHLVLTHAGVPADSPGAAGWNMALDKLAVQLTHGT